MASVQTASGCNALAVSAEYYRIQPERHHLVQLAPCWGNYPAIYGQSVSQSMVNMYDKKTNGFDLQSVVDGLKKAPKGALVLFQTCANNPTGVDPTRAEWPVLSRVCKDHGLVPLMDSAYLGFASGDTIIDSYPIQVMAEDGHNFFITQSFSKNFGLYGERLGALHYVGKDAADAYRVAAQCT